MKCRHCATPLAHTFLDLGFAPPSNAYLTEEDLSHPEKYYPLRVKVCEQCWLAQTEDYAEAEELFSSDYAYFSSTSSSWLDHALHYSTKMIRELALNKDSVVIEVASNDGYLLKNFVAAGITCYGIEPTASTATEARAKGIDTVERFFEIELARELAAQGRQADLMIANNVLAHVPNINDFVAGFALLLKPAGVATFEFPHLLRMVQECQFDTAYHEHYSYLSLTSVQRIFAANGLQVFDVEQLPTHGGSLRVYAQLRRGLHPLAPSVNELLAAEKAAGVATPSFYTGFQHEAVRIRHELLAYLLRAHREGLKVAAYGAAAKGNTLLNFAGVRPDLLPYVVDMNPAKQNKYMPGSHIPIVNEDRLKDDRPDRVLILPWNLREEITTQLAYIHSWAGKFVTAVPALTVWGGGIS